jgi:6,7-dimethyl-8-ribityllumazine synthase
MNDRQIAFVQACWHREIVDQARDSFVHEIEQYGIPRGRIDFYEVPGGLEIPLLAKRLAGTGRYAIIVAAALIVDGGIYRHEFVAGAVIDAIMAVQLECGVPIISVVLTPKHFDDGEERRKFFFEHFKIKGAEAAQACARTLENMAAIEALDRGGPQSTADRA